MKKNLAILTLLSAALLACAEPPIKTEQVALNLATEIKIDDYEVVAGNIYEAVNATLSEAKKVDSSIGKVRLVFGPMKLREKEEPQKLKLKGEATATILRYWAELYRLRISYDGYTIAFSEP